MNKKRWLVRLLAVVVLLWVFLRWFEQKNVFQPSHDIWQTPDHLKRPWDNVTFQTRDGVRISAWFLPAATNAPFKDVAVLIHHGNGGNISHRLPLCEVLLEAGVNVLAYDYRGYGQSDGRPSESGVYLDALAATDWLNQKGFPDSRIVALGESLGGGVATELARQRPSLLGLVLQSTYTSLPDLGSELFPFLPVRTVARYHFNIHSKLPFVRAPLIILHSRADTLIGFHHAEKNLAAANEPKKLIQIAGDHNDQPSADPAGYRDAITGFLRRIRR